MGTGSSSIKKTSRKKHPQHEHLPVLISARRAAIRDLRRLYQYDRLPIHISARPSVPRDPNRPCLALLPEDILLLILESVRESALDDLSSIAAVCTAFYEHARYVQHHTVCVDLERDGERYRQALERNTFPIQLHFLRAVRVLRVKNLSSPRPAGSDINDLLYVVHILGGLMVNMTGLRDFHWLVDSKGYQSMQSGPTPPIPPWILRHLPARARLHASLFCRSNAHEMATEFLTGLEHNKNLVSFHIRIYYEVFSECHLTMEALKRVFLTCPNLKRIPQFFVGCSSESELGNGVVSYRGLYFLDDERPPALTEFGMVQSPWIRQHEESREFMLRSLRFLGPPDTSEEARYWATTFNWTDLTKLHNLHPDMALKVMAKLTKLKEVSFEECLGLYATRATVLFLEQIPVSLEVLSIATWIQVGKVPGPITRHGATLRKLAIHHRFRTDDVFLITDSDLSAILSSLPILEELELDIARDVLTDDWPYNTLNIIAQFLHIQDLKLWFELGDPSYSRPVQLPTPYVTVFTTKLLFDYINTRNKNLRSLVMSALPSAYDYFDYFSGTQYGLYCPISLLCDRSSSGNTSDEGLSVICPFWSKELNTELNLLSRKPVGERKALLEDPNRYSLRVALEGPITRAEWHVWTDSYIYNYQEKEWYDRPSPTFERIHKRLERVQKSVSRKIRSKEKS